MYRMNGLCRGTKVLSRSQKASTSIQSELAWFLTAFAQACCCSSSHQHTHVDRFPVRSRADFCGVPRKFSSLADISSGDAQETKSQNWPADFFASYNLM